MKVFIAGIDGYLGWPLAQYLTLRGHNVAGIDALLRREWVEEVGGQSAIPISSIDDRLLAFENQYGQKIEFHQVNLLDYSSIEKCLHGFQPDAIVHLAEMPSAAYSMIDQKHSVFTQQNNVIGSLNLLWAIKNSSPHSHLVKLGTMGEYGTPNIDIPEGFFELEYRGRKDTLPFPKQANSFYHWSKVHDSNNTMFACRVWNLRATDIMQGVVFGTRFTNKANDPKLNNRLDFDQCFGTAINRFCCQCIIGHPLTVFGSGGQTRGFIPLIDSLQCISLAIENPPQNGEYRVLNQFEQTYSILTLALRVQLAAKELGLEVQIESFENPRSELDQHYYNPDRIKLIELGYQPTVNIHGEIVAMLKDLIPYHDRIMSNRHVLIPDIRWDGSHKRSHKLR